LKVNITDKEIRKAFHNGDNKLILRFVYKEVLPVAISYITKNGGKREDAEDLVHDALISTMRFLDANPYKEIANVAAFLIHAMKNFWINKLKKSGREFQMEVLPDRITEDISSYNYTKEKENAMQKALEKLGETCRKLLTLAIWEDKSMEEVAQALGFANANTAKTKNYQCKQQLATIINTDHYLREALKS
jgi:RNA polymerase sigma factor (sigma-70 family)